MSTGIKFQLGLTYPIMITLGSTNGINRHFRSSHKIDFENKKSFNFNIPRAIYKLMIT